MHVLPSPVHKYLTASFVLSVIIVTIIDAPLAPIKSEDRVKSGVAGIEEAPFQVHRGDSASDMNLQSTVAEVCRELLQKSHEDVMKDFDDPAAFEKSLESEKFPLTDRRILAALTKSFADLITHKVSPEAYQRYAVRIQIIEVLRDWIRPPKELESYSVFSHGERVLRFAERILRIYLTNDALFQEDVGTDVLVNLANALMTLSVKNKSFAVDLERVINRIAELERTEESSRVLLVALQEKDRLELSPQTVERLYIAGSLELVEEPLINSFVENLRDARGETLPRQLEASCRLEQLLNFAATSSTVFQIACGVLNEIFVHSDYSTKALSYIQNFLKSLVSRLVERNKSIVDLYPLHLQSCVILMNIEPLQHTTESREYVLDFLERSHRSNEDETVILVTHYPKWLEFLSKRLADQSSLGDTCE